MNSPTRMSCKAYLTGQWLFTTLLLCGSTMSNQINRRHESATASQRRKRGRRHLFTTTSKYSASKRKNRLPFSTDTCVFYRTSCETIARRKPATRLSKICSSAAKSFFSPARHVASTRRSDFARSVAPTSFKGRQATQVRTVWCAIRASLSNSTT